MLYDIYHNVCMLIIKVLNMRIPWSGECSSNYSTGNCIFSSYYINH